MKKVVDRFRKLMLCSFLTSLLDIIVGILFIIFTDVSTKIIVIVLGAIILVHGLFCLIRYIYDGLGTKFFAIDLILGVAAIILGVFVIFSPLNALNFMGVYFCGWLLVNGIEKIYYGYKFMKANEDIYPLVSFIGILTILMGVLVSFNPFKGFMLITRLTGLFLMASGLLDILSGMLFRKRAKEILQIVK